MNKNKSKLPLRMIECLINMFWIVRMRNIISIQIASAVWKFSNYTCRKYV